jgi:hypothetical protein
VPDQYPGSEKPFLLDGGLKELQDALGNAMSENGPTGSANPEIAALIRQDIQSIQARHGLPRTFAYDGRTEDSRAEPSPREQNPTLALVWVDKEDLEENGPNAQPLPIGISIDVRNIATFGLKLVSSALLTQRGE